MTDASPSTQSVSARWRAAAEKALKGRSLDSITWRFEDGFELPAMATAEDSAELPHLVVPPRSAAGFLSVCPLHTTRTLDEVLVDAEELLAQGFDRLALDGYDHTDELLNRLPPGCALVEIYAFTGHLGQTASLLARDDGTPLLFSSPYDSASPAQQIAYQLAELTRRLRWDGPDELTARTVLGVPVGPELLTEIAKLRALRLLADKVTHHFGVDDRVSLMATQSLYHDTRFDPETNLLRASLSGVAALSAGVEFVQLTQFDSFGCDPPSDSTRLVRNQLRMLELESFADRVGDPTAGAYTIEALTHAIASTAWGYFQALAAAGLTHPDPELWRVGDEDDVLGLADTESLRIDDVRTRRRVVVGVNRFADPALDTEQGPSAYPDVDYCDDELNLDEDNFRMRAALPFEWLRDRILWFQEDGGRRPGVQTIGFGPKGLARARAEFANDFFRAGGFRAEESLRADDVDAAVALADDSDAAVFVLCGPDDAYATFAPAFVAGLRAVGSEALVYAAGPFPDDGQDAGLTGYVHRHADAFDILRNALDRLGLPALPEWEYEEDAEERA